MGDVGGARSTKIAACGKNVARTRSALESGLVVDLAEAGADLCNVALSDPRNCCQERLTLFAQIYIVEFRVRRIPEEAVWQRRSVPLRKRGPAPVPPSGSR